MLELKVILTEVQSKLVLEHWDAVVNHIDRTGAAIKHLELTPNVIISAEGETGLIAAEVDLKWIISRLLKYVKLPERPRRPAFTAVEAVVYIHQTILAPGKPVNTNTLKESPKAQQEFISPPRSVIQQPSVQRENFIPNDVPPSSKKGSRPSLSQIVPPSFLPSSYKPSGVVIRMPPELKKRFGDPQAPSKRPSAVVQEGGL